MSSSGLQGVLDMSNCAVESIESFHTGQKVYTNFGPGVISAISYIDSIVYVTMTDARSGLYVMRPEQIRAMNE
jgi:hypothetical protein